ncbi:hypothetical protein P885DRAFT_34743 [Corynascus similis CBS 632.67]
MASSSKSDDNENRMLRVTIESERFPGSYLRIDGQGVNTPLKDGGGVVNCQNHVGPYEIFNIVNYPEENTFAILSTAFRNVFLRMDGSDVKHGPPYPKGAGKVNCQDGAHAYEKFRFRDLEGGIKAIESVHFPGVFLRMENPGHDGPKGGGTVNCQNQITPTERFKIKIYVGK